MQLTKNVLGFIGSFLIATLKAWSNNHHYIWQLCNGCLWRTMQDTNNWWFMWYFEGFLLRNTFQTSVCTWGKVILCTNMYCIHMAPNGSHVKISTLFHAETYHKIIHPSLNVSCTIHVEVLRAVKITNPVFWFSFQRIHTFMCLNQWPVSTIGRNQC